MTLDMQDHVAFAEWRIDSDRDRSDGFQSLHGVTQIDLKLAELRWDWSGGM
jgi:hypothetical protein